MLSLSRRTATLAHINVRTEKSGEENVSAVDLKITFRASNAFLNDLAPGLREAWFAPPEAKDAKELFETPDHFPRRRWPLIATFAWDLQMIGREVIINYGLDEQSDIRFATANANKFRVQCYEGGSVEIALRVQAHPTSEQMAKLYDLLGHEIDIAIGLGSGEQHSMDERGSDGDADGDGDDAGSDADGEEQGQVFPDAMDGRPAKRSRRRGGEAATH